MIRYSKNNHTPVLRALMIAPETPTRPTPPYINDRDMLHESWKIFQVIAEIVEGYERLSHIHPAISLFGSGRIAPDHPDYRFTEILCRTLSDAGFTIVTGGGPGLMEAANKGASAGSSASIGLNIVLPSKEAQNHYLDISLRFRHFFTRKLMFVKYASAFIGLPGGMGTLDEVSEVLALIQTHKTQRIPVILVKRSFWSGLIQWIRSAMLPEGLIHPDDLQLIQVVDTVEEVLAAIEAFYLPRGGVNPGQ